MSRGTDRVSGTIQRACVAFAILVVVSTVTVIPRPCERETRHAAVLRAIARCVPLRRPSTAKTANYVIIDEADGLHEGVDDRRADEVEAAGAQVARKLLRERRLGGHVVQGGGAVDQRFAVHVRPQKIREGRALGRA